MRNSHRSRVKRSGTTNTRGHSTPVLPLATGEAARSTAGGWERLVDDYGRDQVAIAEFLGAVRPEIEGGGQVARTFGRLHGALWRHRLARAGSLAR
ncbi:MAG: hypothetical protein ACKVT1_14285 [Dehalococcoidia bacterium]